MLTILFAATLFLSATLLFWVQPLVARMLLPLLGGAPAVWNTCLVFFQATLLAGYAYAHWNSTRLPPRAQCIFHSLLLLGAAVFLPFQLSESAVAALRDNPHPAGWLIGALLGLVGLPIFVLAANTPLLQHWFSDARHGAARDPYFLYAASNAGSLAALLAFPIILEPSLGLSEQAGLWAAGFWLLILMIALCAWRGGALDAPARAPVVQAASPAMAAPAGRRWLWVGLSFIPSSLMLGVTNFLGTDIASVPLLWVVPLALYLLTFIIAFGSRRLAFLPFLFRVLPFLAVAVMFLILARATDPVALLIALHLIFFTAASLACHGRLAALRPPAERLTEFYLCLSCGGVLGGIFNALVAPAVFSTVIEYPLAIVLACLVRPAPASASADRSGRAAVALDFAFPIALGMFTAALAVTVTLFELESVPARNAIILGIPLLLGFAFVRRPLRFGLSLGAILAGAWFYTESHGQTLHLERNFFGISRVTLEPSGLFRRLVHGNTVHGRQFLDPARACEPLTYYHRSGPLGDVFAAYRRTPGSPHVAVIGLGSGSMIGYSQAGQTWTFYEIDPAVIGIARNTNYFSYLRHCSQAPVHIITGDARLRLREAPLARYGLLVIDAFNSDAIPVHLLTREALELYRSKLAPGGLLAFHISNRYLDLEPVMGDLAADAGLICLAWDDTSLSPQDSRNGKEKSHWAVMARRPADLEPMEKNPLWIQAKARTRPRVWTDDYSNVLSVFRWH